MGEQAICASGVVARSPKPVEWLDPTRAAQAALAVKQSLFDLAGDDEDLFLDMIEGETGLIEIIDRLLARRAEHLALAEGLSRHVELMKSRQARFERVAEQDRLLVTQALLIAELGSLKRPTATLTMSARGVKLVVDEEADIPAAYFKPGDPKLDRTALAAALKVRAEAMAGLPEDPEARAAALAALPGEVPGAHLEAAAPSLTIRER